MLKHKTIFADPRLIPFVLEYQIVMAIAGQEKEVHLAAALGSIARALAGNQVGQKNSFNQLYAEWAFYNHMHHALSSGWVTGIRYLLSRTTREWVAHFRKESGLIRKSLSEQHSQTEGIRLTGRQEKSINLPTRIVLLIDSSGSMTGSDPRNLRIEAARMFMRSADSREQVSLWEFDSTASCLADFSAARTKKIAAAAGIDARGGTRIGAALKEVRSYLTRSPKSGSIKTAVLLLTDGKSNDCAEEVKYFKKMGWKIFSLGLGSSVNETMLASMADSTGGSYFHLRSSQDILRFYSGMRSFMGIGQLLVLRRFHMLPKQKKTVEMELHPADRNLRVTVAWPGSDVTLQLMAPSGKLYKSILHPGHYREILVEKPKAGKWLAEITGTDLPLNGEAVDLRGEVKNEQLNSVLTGLRNRWNPGQTVEFQLSGNSAAQVTRAFATVSGPQGLHTQVKGRITAGSAVFKLGNFVSCGNYQVLINAGLMQSSGTVFPRIWHRMFRVDQPVGSSGGIVTGIRGSYLEINLGRADGLEPGMRVAVKDPDKSILRAEAFVASILGDHRAMIEVQTLLGMKRPQKGMKVTPMYTRRENR